MLSRCLVWLRRRVQRGVDAIRTRASRWTRPRPLALATGLAADLTRSRGDLLPENALLRQQVLVLRRTVQRPALTPLDRGLLVVLASGLRTWADTLLIVQPDTVVRWHRMGVRLFWPHKSAPRSRPSPLATTTIDLIRQMARDNPLWGAERIRGELLKLDIRVSKRMIQKHLRQARSPRPTGQTLSVRQECLDHLLILHAGQLRRALRAYCAYYNAARPHQGLGQTIPGAPGPAPGSRSTAPIVAIPILGGLHHDDRRAS